MAMKLGLSLYKKKKNIFSAFEKMYRVEYLDGEMNGGGITST
jgi:hypothetical protein